jgi:adenylate cyclase
MVREFDPTTRAMMHLYRCMALPGGLLLPDAMALQETAETLGVAERSGDDLALDAARFARGVTLVECGGPHRRDGFELLAQARDAAAQGRFSVAAISGVDVQAAKEMVRTGDLDGAIALSRMVVDGEFEAASVVARVVATEVLVEALLQRGSDADLGEADAALDRLVAAPTEPGFVLHDVPLLRLRALLARARGDEAGYRDFVDRYRARATEVGFEGHMAIANSMS